MMSVSGIAGRAWKTLLAVGLLVHPLSAWADVYDCRFFHITGDERYIPEVLTFDTAPKGGLYSQYTVSGRGSAPLTFGPLAFVPEKRRNGIVLMNWERRGLSGLPAEYNGMNNLFFSARLEPGGKEIRLSVLRPKRFFQENTSAVARGECRKR